METILSNAGHQTVRRLGLFSCKGMATKGFYLFILGSVLPFVIEMTRHSSPLFI
jgi:hypothetical protein